MHCTNSRRACCGDGISSTCAVRHAQLQCQVAFKMDIATVFGVWNRLRGLQQPCCSGLGVGRPAGKTPSQAASAPAAVGSPMLRLSGFEGL